MLQTDPSSCVLRPFYYIRDKISLAKNARILMTKKKKEKASEGMTALRKNRFHNIEAVLMTETSTRVRESGGLSLSVAVKGGFVALRFFSSFFFSFHQFKGESGPSTASVAH